MARYNCSQSSSRARWCGSVISDKRMQGYDFIKSGVKPYAPPIPMISLPRRVSSLVCIRVENALLSCVLPCSSHSSTTSSGLIIFCKVSVSICFCLSASFVRAAGSRCSVVFQGPFSRCRYFSHSASIAGSLWFSMAAISMLKAISCCSGFRKSYPVWV